jgi:hypothetical protein
MNDTEMLDWLAERCLFPDDIQENEGYIPPEMAVLVPEEFAPIGAFSGKPETDRRALREAIQKARLKELHDKQS